MSTEVGMDGSILELQTGSSAAGGLIQAVESSWRAVGRRGRVVTVVGLVGLVLVTCWWVPVSPLAVATGLAVGVLLVAALVDAVEHRLPNALVALAALPVVVAVAASWSGDVLRAAVVGAAVVGGPLLVTHLVAPGGMGFGDVKAATVLGAALALLAVPIALLALVVGLLTAAVAGLATRARTVALGPALVAGALLALVVGRLAGVEVVAP